MAERPFTKEQLARFRKNLEEKRAYISTQLKQIQEKDLPDMNKMDHGDSYGDDAKKDQILSRMIGKAEHLRREMASIEAALLRIENRTYGIDARTGAPISMERLMANPLATTALDPEKPKN